MGILADSAPRARDLAVREHVRLALGMISPRPTPARIERRRETRHAFPYPVRLTPISGEGQVCVGDELVVIAKHLSELGIDFYCSEPLPHRRVIASLPCGTDECVSLLLELTWCRFGAHTWYENGGRFLQPVRCPGDLPEPASVDILKIEH